MSRSSYRSRSSSPETHAAKVNSNLKRSYRSFTVTRTTSKKQHQIRAAINKIVKEKTSFECRSCFSKSIVIKGPKDYKTFVYSISCKTCKRHVNTTLEKLKESTDILNIFWRTNNLQNLLNSSSDSSEPSSPQHSRQNNHQPTSQRKMEKYAISDLAKDKSGLLLNQFVSNLNLTLKHINNNASESIRIPITNMIQQNQIEIAKVLKNALINSLKNISNRSQESTK